MPKYRAGIIGLSDIAAAPAPPAPHPVLGVRQPYSHLAGYAETPAVELVAACEINLALVAQFQAQWGSRWPQAQTYTDYRAMLAEQRLDILSLCTPDHLHADMVIAACEAGVKGIICEKPLATTLSDADRMIAAVERHGVKMSVEHTRRWIHDFHEARALVRQGKIGRLSRIVATINGERAMLFRNGTHLIDLTCFFAESEPAWVIGVLDAAFEGYGLRYAGDGGRLPSTDPGALGIIAFQNGVRALYQGSQGTVAYSGIDLIGDRGRINLGIADHKMDVAYAGPDGPYDLIYRTLPRAHSTRPGLQAVVQEMVDLLDHGGESVSPPREARRVVEIMLGLLQSAARGGVRVDMPIQDA